MKSGSLILLLLASIFCSAAVAGEFDELPYFPDGATDARLYSDGKRIKAPYSPVIKGVLDELYGGRGRDVFDLWGAGPAVGWDAAPPPGDELVVAKVSCLEGLECITLNAEAATFLITFTKNYQRMIDYSIISASESVRDEEVGYNYSGIHIGTLPFSIKKVDFFCSQVSGRDISGYLFYKRWITSEGKIENKQSESWNACHDFMK